MFGAAATRRLIVFAPVAQLDRAPGYEPGGREFESLRAHHISRTHAAHFSTTVPFKGTCAIQRPMFSLWFRAWFCSRGDVTEERVGRGGRSSRRNMVIREICDGPLKTACPLLEVPTT